MGFFNLIYIFWNCLCGFLTQVIGELEYENVKHTHTICILVLSLYPTHLLSKRSQGVSLLHTKAVTVTDTHLPKDD